MTSTVAQILHLEDSDVDGELIRGRLTKAGLNVEIEQVADEGRFLDRLKAKKFDLILSVAQVPGFDGLEALRLARELQPATPFIFVAGATSEESAVDSLSRGATDYVHKQRLTRLLPAVERALEGAKERRERQAAEDALRDQQKLFRTTLSSIGDGVISTDTLRRVTYMNDEAERLTGRRFADVAGRLVDGVFHVIDETTRRRIDCPVTKVIATGRAVTPRSHSVLVAEDGMERPIDDSAEPIKDEAGNAVGVVLVFRDLTERKHAERRLHETEERFAFVCRSSGVGFWYCDLPFDALEWDANTKEHFHLPPNAYVTINTFYERLHPDDREPTRAAIDRAIRERVPYDIDYRTVDPESSGEKWIRAMGRTSYAADGTPRRFDGITIDVTDRKREEQQLARLLTEEKRHSSLLARVARASRSINAVLSMESIARILTEEARSIIGAREASVSIKTDGTDADVVTAVSRAASRDEADDGVVGSSSTDVLAVPLIGHGGQHLGMLRLTGKRNGSFSDGDRSVLSQLAAIAAVGIENARLYDSLREQDRRKDEFLATLAHELRNPLAPVRTGLEILKLAGDDERGRAARDTMERQINHMVRLVDDLLDVSRVSSGKVALKHDYGTLRSIFDLALETSLPLIEGARHRLDVTLASESLVVYGDLTRLAQVLSNLLNNAAKYTPDGGRISLSAAERDGYIVVQVSDTGMGIPSDMLPKVFDLFTQVGRTVDRSQGGLGIGLSLVKRLVEMHGGTVSAESAGAGAGSTFTVRLPASRVVNEHAPSPTATTSSNARNGASRKVLIVDDNVDAADTLSTLLGILQHETRITHSGTEALAEAPTFGPDIVFLDIGLPGMNGYEVARRLRSDGNLHDVVLVALTGWGTEEDRRKSIEAGFDCHLTKPIDQAALQEAIAKCSRASGSIPPPPCPESQAAGASPLRDGGGEKTPCSRRILVVDDNRDSADLLGRMLKLLGHDVRTAYDGLSALDAAAEFRPDAAFLDVGLPQLNGYDVCRRMREQPWGREMLILALTGWSQDEDRRRSREAGFDHHLVKPVDLSKVKQILAGAF